MRVEQDGPVVTVTLAAPERRNAQTPSTWRTLSEIGAGLGPDVRGVLLQADGPSFSAGLDRRMLSPEGVPGEPSFAELAALPVEELDTRIAEYQAGFTWWRREDLVTVAAVQGHAVGAGFQLALACDLRVVADDVQLCMREPTLGLVPDLTGTGPLVAAVGYARAVEICLSGRWVGAEEAVSCGLASLSTRPEELRERARAVLDELVAGPRGAAAETKALLRRAAVGDSADQHAAERAAQGRLLRAMLTALGNNPTTEPG